MKKFFTTAFAIIGMCFTMHAVEPSGTLPVLYINTQNGEEITSKETYLQADYWLDPKGDSTVEAVGSADAPLLTQIKGRGNYTWTGFDKKPYRLKLDKKEALMGMPKSKHWGLLAHADDNLGFLRNAVGLQTSRLMGLNWTPGDKQIELVINGDYRGVYFLTELIKIDENRVNIFEMEDNVTDDVTGGWLVEIDNYDTDPHVTVTEGNGETIWFTYKSPEILSNEQEMYLETELNRLNDLIYGSKESDELWNHLDIDQAARFYVVQEMMDDCESYHGSCYLYKDKGENTKWNFGPVWDFGNAFQRGDKSQYVWQDATFNQTWIGELYKFPKFQEKVKEVWKEFVETGYPTLEAYIQEYAAKISTAGINNNQRWPQYGNEDIMSKKDMMSNYIRKSADWLGGQWGGKPENPLEVYARGSFNNWEVRYEHKLQAIGNDIYVLSNFNMATSDSFKLSGTDWSVFDYGGRENDRMQLEMPYSLVQNGSNLQSAIDFSDKYLVYDHKNKTLLITRNLPSGIDEISTDNFGGNDTDSIEYYTISGMRVDTPTQPGIYIKRIGGKATKIHL